MPIYFYAPVVTKGLPELMDLLKAKRLYKHDGMRFLHKGVPQEFTQQDTLVCWGVHTPPVTNVHTLNTSYFYQNQLAVNERGLRRLRSEGYDAFVPTRIKNSTWKEMLPISGSWWPKQARSGHVALPEFEGLVTSFYRFKSVNRALVFNNAVLSGTAPNIITKMIQGLQLSFAEVWCGESVEQTFLLKVITAPALEKAEITLMADSILNDIKLAKIAKGI